MFKECHYSCCHTCQNLEDNLTFPFAHYSHPFAAQMVLILFSKCLFNQPPLPRSQPLIKPVSLLIPGLLIIRLLLLSISSSHLSSTPLPELSCWKQPDSHFRGRILASLRNTLHHQFLGYLIAWQRRSRFSNEMPSPSILVLTLVSCVPLISLTSESVFSSLKWW